MFLDSMKIANELQVSIPPMKAVLGLITEPGERG